MSRDYFGCYYEFYALGLAHLGLLHLGDTAESETSARMLAQIRTVDSWPADTAKLLSEANWRGHLAPLVSYLASGIRDDEIEEMFWACIGKGSWVIPQLIAGLHLAGSPVAEKAVAIASAGITRNIGDPLIAHVETGPGSDRSRVGKVINSLLGLGLRAEIALTDEDIAQLVAYDIDNADDIARSWHASMAAVLESIRR